MGRLLLLSMFFVSLSIHAQNCPTVTNPNQEFCDFFVIEGTENVDQSRIKDLQADGHGETVYWYLEAQGGEPLDNELVLTDGAVYYAGYLDSCYSRPSVTVKMNLSPVAGQTWTAYLCSNSEPVEIYTLFPVLSDGRTVHSGGTLNKTLASGGTLFDPGKDIGGSYKYTVTNDCATDDATLTIIIIEAPYAGEGGEYEYLTTDEPVELMTLLGPDAQSGGTWSSETPVDGQFDPTASGAGTFSFTYRIESTTETGDGKIGPVTCEDSATIDITVIQASDDQKVVLCHKGKTLEVDSDALQAHLDHGDSEGACDEAASKTVVSPNPSHGDFNFSNKSVEIQKIRILNFQGGVETEFTNSGAPNLLEVNLNEFKKGIYFAEVITNKGKEVLKLIKK